MNSKAFKVIKFILSNLTLALAILVMTLFILDKFNPAVGFMVLDMAKIFILILSVFAIVHASISIVESVLSYNKKK